MMVFPVVSLPSTYLNLHFCLRTQVLVQKLLIPVLCTWMSKKRLTSLTGYKVKKPTWKFSSILFGVTLLGITTTPRWIWNLIQIWAGDFPYISAISAIVGFFNKAGSSAVAHGRSGEPSGLYAVTNKEPKHLKITYCNIEEQRHRVSNQIHSRKSNYFEYDII